MVSSVFVCVIAVFGCVLIVLQWRLEFRDRIRRLEKLNASLEREVAAHKDHAKHLRDLLDLHRKEPRSVKYALVMIDGENDGIGFAMKSLGLDVPPAFKKAKLKDEPS